MSNSDLVNCVCTPGDFKESCPVHTPEHYDGLSVGNICNPYGGLRIKNNAGKYYWGIDDATGPIIWEEISAQLYTLLEATNQK